jgi:hypothetical protein
MKTLLDIDYSLLPEHMREGARLYIEQGVEPGGFMTAVLCNNLVDAFGKADDINTLYMANWVRWFYNECPSNAWGSRDKINNWILGKKL